MAGTWAGSTQRPHPIRRGPLLSNAAASHGDSGAIGSRRNTLSDSHRRVTETRSATQRPMGPAAGRIASWPFTPPRRETEKPLRVIRCGVGLNPATPQKCAGIRMLPPMSVPRPRSEPRAATRAPSPPLLPPLEGGRRGVASEWGVCACATAIGHGPRHARRSLLVPGTVGAPPNVVLGLWYHQRLRDVCSNKRDGTRLAQGRDQRAVLVAPVRSAHGSAAGGEAAPLEKAILHGDGNAHQLARRVPCIQAPVRLAGLLERRNEDVLCAAVHCLVHCPARRAVQPDVIAVPAAARLPPVPTWLHGTRPGRGAPT